MSHPSDEHTFFTDLNQLYRNIDAATNGQASVLEVNEMSVKIGLHPKTGCNAHAFFVLTVEASPAYPRRAPAVTFDTPIFHPNISCLTGSICFNLLDEWRSYYTLLDVVKGILYLIEHPNFLSANNTIGYVDDPSLLPKMSARLLAGLPVNGRYFPANTKWCEWALANGCLPTDCEKEAAETQATWQVMDTTDEDNNERESDFATEARTSEKEEFDREASDRASVALPHGDTSRADNRRCAISPNDSQSWMPDEMKFSDFQVEFQRVVIWQSQESGKADKNSTFYFIEVLGGRHHRDELGSLYTALFTDYVPRDSQMHSTSRQTSSLCPWSPFPEKHPGSYVSSESIFSYVSRNTVPQVEDSFENFISGKRTLTSDFCPWSLMDGQGINNLFGRLFFQGEREGRDFTCFLDADVDSGEDSEGIGRLFIPGTPEPEDEITTIEEQSESQVYESESQSEVSEEVIEVVPPPEPLPANEVDESDLEPPSCHPAIETYKPFIRPLSSVTSLTYARDDNSQPLMKNCAYCYYDYIVVKERINAHLAPQWKWIFRQTRWSIRFAPQQVVQLSTEDISIPPWRVSSGRLISDICRFCARNSSTRWLVLLDPLALSPLSPLLNLMQQCVEEKPRLNGVLWMTTWNALSPFSTVPALIARQREEDETTAMNVGGGRVGGYPRPAYLRFLTVTTFLTNWVAWFTRIEAYASLGTSRFREGLISAPVAACLLQPFSLGCGQAPIFDLWPLWLLRQTLTLSLSLPTLRLPFISSNRYHLKFCIPFSDLDEI